MKNIINVIIKAAIIAGAAYLFPEYVVCSAAKALVLAIICMMITGIVLGIATYGILIILAATDHAGMGVFIAIVMAFLSGIIQLAAATHFVSGFEIHGLLAYIILTVLMSILSIPENNKSSK